MLYFKAKEFEMGIVHAEITLKNACDEGNASAGHIKPEDVRSVTVTAIADTGALNLVINEEVRQKLGLSITGESTALIANGQRVKCQLTEAVYVHWKNRKTPCSAVVIPEAKAILFGAIPLEGMDLMVDPVSQEVVGAHGDIVETLILGAAA